MTRNILVALFRSDLRLHDNPLIHLAAEQTPSSSSSAWAAGTKFRKPITHFLPIYVYDQRAIEVGGLQGIDKGQGGKEARTRTAGFWRCGEQRARCVQRNRPEGGDGGGGFAVSEPLLVWT